MCTTRCTTKRSASPSASGAPPGEAYGASGAPPPPEAYGAPPGTTWGGPPGAWCASEAPEARAPPGAYRAPPPSEPVTSRPRQSLAAYYLTHPPHQAHNAHNAPPAHDEEHFGFDDLDVGTEAQQDEDDNVGCVDHNATKKTPRKGKRKNQNASPTTLKKSKKQKKKPGKTRQEPQQSTQSSDPVATEPPEPPQVSTWSAVYGVSVDKGLPGEYYVSVCICAQD